MSLEEVVVKSESSLQKILKLAFSSTDDFIEAVAKNLASKGLTIRKVEDGVFEVLYKGVVVESGTEQKVGAFLKKMYYNGPRNAGKVLEELLNSAKGLIRKIVYSGGQRGEIALSETQKKEILEYAKLT